MFEMELYFESGARTLLAAKTIHRDLKTGLVVRQALTSSELALQRRYLQSSTYKELREKKVALLQGATTPAHGRWRLGVGASAGGLVSQLPASI